MKFRAISPAILAILISVAATAQVFMSPAGNSDGFNSAIALDAIHTGEMEFTLMTINSQNPDMTTLQSRSNSVSKLDLKAPGKAKKEYDEGYRLLMRKDLQAALAHLSSAVTIYPRYVAAHNALGTAYLDLNQNEQARAEFEKSIELDDHLASSFLNLGCANLSLKQFAPAEAAFRKASDIAPLDAQAQLALAYGELQNKNYSGVLETVKKVHEKPHHEKAVLVHYFAAGAWEAQENFPEAQKEMATLLQEDPKSELADNFRAAIEQLKLDEAKHEEAKLHPAEPTTFSFASSVEPSADAAMQHARRLMQEVKERSQIAEAEAAPAMTCENCGSEVTGPATVEPEVQRAKPGFSGTLFRTSVDEVALYFTATDHGKSVMDLQQSDVGLSDDGKRPVAILGFRNESQLPLRLGFIIDTSDSVAGRLNFEEAAAEKFLQSIMKGKDDLAFVVGVNNSVLMEQDFTGDQSRITQALEKLAAGGGTALWDAVSFSAEKLAHRSESQPVARILVVVSDGQDNSSQTTLKETIAEALRGEVAVYTVSTRELTELDESSILGDRALKTLSELTGGATFVPGSVKSMSKSLTELEQVIRGRYLVSYRPASFQRNGHYRAVDLKAQKSGRSLKIYARKGYYASAAVSQPRAQ